MRTFSGLWLQGCFKIKNVLKSVLHWDAQSSRPSAFRSSSRTQRNYILRVLGLGKSAIPFLHIYCELHERSRNGEAPYAAYVCSGYCLCRSDRMKEQWVSFQFLMSTSNYLFNFMPGEALYSYMQKHFTSFVMLCFGCHWLAFQLTDLITTWI